MDLDNLEIRIGIDDSLTDAQREHAKKNPDFIKDMEVFYNKVRKEAAAQIADYIKTFRVLPTKNVWFEGIECDDYNITLMSVSPTTNYVWCYIEFEHEERNHRLML